MVAMRMENFGGMVPLLSPRLLPENMAALAVNAYLRAGEVRGLREPIAIKTYPNGGGDPVYERAFRIPDPVAPLVPVWLPMLSRYADLFPNPLKNDAFNRYIWLDENAPGTAKFPRQNSLARIKLGDPYILLGVPAPAAAMALSVVGGAAPIITRSYVYTYVNLFGEEGPPSDPITVSGNQSGSWNLSGIVNPAFATERGITLVRIYRTITGASGSTTFFRVVEQAVATATYNDTRLDSEVAAEGLLLESTAWEPPLEMEGIILMPNGFFAGWKGKNIYFSEPYRPWAWPPAYTLTAEFNILDCGVVEQTLVALTATAPVLVTGIQPATMSISKTSYVEPCVNPNSIAQAPEGVYFGSQNGLMLISSMGLTPITRQVVGRDDWQTDYVPQINSSVVFDSQYVVMGEDGNGFIFDPRGIQNGIIQVANFPATRAIWTDPWTSEAHMMIDNTVYEWGRSEAAYVASTWLSKPFQFPRPLNFGAVMVTLDPAFAIGSESGIVDQTPEPEGSPWLDNISLVNYNIVNGFVPNEGPLEGATPPSNPTADPWPFWYGVVPDVSDPPLPSGAVCELTIYAGQSVVFRQIVVSGQVYRPPSGFKNDTWQVQVRSRVPVLNIQIAETSKELTRV